jgi:Fe-S-cluster containining protein
LKKRKKRRGKRPAPNQNAPDALRNIRFLKPDDTFNFVCSRCGECCRHVEYSVMLEPFDIFRIAGYLKRNGYAMLDPEDVIMEYADVKALGSVEYPVFLLKTAGARKECVFLRDGCCSIHEAKPRACRLYPLGAWPNDDMNGFDYFIASQRSQHFHDPSIRAGDWMDENFSAEERAIVLADAQSTAEIAPLLQRLKKVGADWDRVLHPLILFKYVCFELDEPFMPQYTRNMDWLKRTLLGIAEETGGVYHVR